LVRRLQQEGFSVEVVDDSRGLRNSSLRSLLPRSPEKSYYWTVRRIQRRGQPGKRHRTHRRGQRTDLLLVAPATADILAKFSRGISDDFLSTLYLASTAPVIVARHERQHVESSGDPGKFGKTAQPWRTRVNPDEGYLACGMTGAGRLAGQDAIIAAVRESFKFSPGPRRPNYFG